MPISNKKPTVTVDKLTKSEKAQYGYTSNKAPLKSLQTKDRQYKDSVMTESKKKEPIYVDKNNVRVKSNGEKRNSIVGYKKGGKVVKAKIKKMNKGGKC